MKTSQPVKITKNVLKLLFTALFLITLIIFSCEKNNIESDEAPQLPPEESFIIDFSDFNDNSDTLNSSKSTLTYKH